LLTVVPRHAREELHRGILLRIVKQASIDPDEFFRYSARRPAQEGIREDREPILPRLNRNFCIVGPRLASRTGGPAGGLSMPDKVIVTNRSALTKKYGSQGWTRIAAAIQGLQSADHAKGLETQLILLDDAAQMKAVKGTRVTKVTDPRQAKRAVDKVYRALAPDYLLLLGSVDVVPHQDLNNPMPGDQDLCAYGDLPYACEAAYSKDASKFVGPTRVVGRLPDLTGATDPAYLLGLLGAAAGWRGLSPAEYHAYLGVSAQVWQGSTALSLQNVFHGSQALQVAPTKGPQWPSSLLQARMHFINCHGAPSSAQFYGQRGNSYPVSHDAAYLQGKVREGTVVAAECCYGAELYDPRGGQKGISATYLEGKAYAFFGSTTIAYGPAEGNGSADLICQYFLKRVLAGASTGRAALEARQQFAQQSAALEPQDLKTLAQFNLLGDPSVTPVATGSPPPHSVPKAMAAAPGNGKSAAAPAGPAPSAASVSRGERRRALFANGLAIVRTLPVASGTPKGKPKASIAAALDALTGDLGLKEVRRFTSAVRQPPGPATKAMPLALAPKLEPASAFHVVMGKRGEGGDGGPVRPLVAIVAKEAGGRIVSYRQLESR
jgi:hypothetical protein